MFLWFFTWQFSHMCSDWTVSIILGSRYSYYHCLIDEDLEAERGSGTAQGCRVMKWQKQGLNSGFLSIFYATFTTPPHPTHTFKKERKTSCFCFPKRTALEGKGKNNWKCTLYTLSLKGLCYSCGFKPPRSVFPAQTFILSSGIE